MGTSLKTAAVAVVAACLLGHAPGVSAEWLLDAETGLVYESNVGLSPLRRDVKGDVAASTAVSAGVGTQLDDHTFASLTADVGGQAYGELDGLDHVAIGLTGAIRRKLGLGASAPWVRLSGSGARLDYEDDVRTGWRYRFAVDVGGRVGERWALRGGWAFEERRADHARVVSSRLPGDAFDVQGHTFSARADVAATERLSLFGGYAVRTGDVVASTRRDPAIFVASTALTRDRALGPDFVAYRVDALVHALTLGLSVAVTDRLSLNASYERLQGFAKRGIDYGNDVVRAGLLFTY
ncbi:MAG TPA: hypothetical protein VEA38_11475 [Terriglobales bacterium]|nr:hypothetical protein [Terriglobales bacterium]